MPGPLTEKEWQERELASNAKQVADIDDQKDLKAGAIRQLEQDIEQSKQALDLLKGNTKPEAVSSNSKVPVVDISNQEGINNTLIPLSNRILTKPD